MTANDEKPKKPEKLTQDEYNALAPEFQHQHRQGIRMWDEWHDKKRRMVVTTEDIKESFKSLAAVMLEMPPPEKNYVFVEVLADNGISKWELMVATKEILRSRSKVLVPSEYFHALSRVRARLLTQNRDMYDKEALDF